MVFLVSTVIIFLTLGWILNRSWKFSFNKELPQANLDQGLSLGRIFLTFGADHLRGMSFCQSLWKAILCFELQGFSKKEFFVMLSLAPFGLIGELLIAAVIGGAGAWSFQSAGLSIGEVASGLHEFFWSGDILSLFFSFALGLLLSFFLPYFSFSFKALVFLYLFMEFSAGSWSLVFLAALVCGDLCFWVRMGLLRSSLRIPSFRASSFVLVISVLQFFLVGYALDLAGILDLGIGFFGLSLIFWWGVFILQFLVLGHVLSKSPWERKWQHFLFTPKNVIRSGVGRKFLALICGEAQKKLLRMRQQKQELDKMELQSGQASIQKLRIPKTLVEEHAKELQTLQAWVSFGDSNKFLQ